MPYIKVVVEGGFTSNAEVWSTGVAVLVDGPPPSQAALDGYANSVMTFLVGADPSAQALRGTLSTVCQIQRVRAYYYDAPNTPASLMGLSVTAGLAGTGTFTLPLQCARVISLSTGIPGVSFRGRMYWPKLTGSIVSTGTDSSVNQGFADAFADFLGVVALAAPSTSAGRIAVVSKTKAIITPVISLRVGNVVDTQRRRRDTIVETFFSSTV